MTSDDANQGQSRGEALLGRLAAKRQRLEARHRILATVRAYFTDLGFIEVETPLRLSAIAPEEHIVPVSCRAGVLATSPELQMKQLVASGMTHIFQLTRSFREGEKGRLHAPEFAILEWYRPGNSVHDLVRDLEGLFAAVAAAVAGRSVIEWQTRSIDLSPGWPVTTVRDAFLRLAGWDPVAKFDATRFDLDLVERVEPNLGRGRPEVLAFYPAALGSLSRPLPDDPAVSQRMELYVEGLELANGFVELSDEAEQRRRFEQAAATIAARDGFRPQLPELFLDTVAQLPDCVGIALGLDRLVMLFTDALSLAQVTAFGPEDV